MSIRLFIIMSILLVSNCENKSNLEREDFILNEKDLIPEGLAFDKRTGVIYIGSTYKRKIVQIKPNGVVTDFISTETDGIWGVVGMEVDEKRGVLWVNTAHANEVMPLTNPNKEEDWMTGILSYTIKQKKLIKRYDLNEPKGFFNDITVSENGDVYATESVNNKIYRIESGKDELQLFLDPKGFTFLNGITYVDSLKVLFVASTQGIFKVDVNSKKYTLLKTAKNINAKKIDGLAYYHNFLIGHQSSKVSKFYLNTDQTEIPKVEILDTRKEFDSSTTGEVGNGYYYYIVNSQISSGIDYENRTLKPLDSLEKIIIRKLKL